MLEDQPLDLSVRVGDYAEVAASNSRDEENNREEDIDESSEQGSRRESLEDYGNAATALRLRGLVAAAVAAASSYATAAAHDYSQDREDRTCSEDSDDSCSDTNRKDPATGRPRARPPGTKPYKKNLMRRYRELLKGLFFL